MISAKEARELNLQSVDSFIKEHNIEYLISEAATNGFSNIEFSAKGSIKEPLKTNLINKFEQLGYKITIKDCYKYNDCWNHVIISWKEE